MEEVLGTLDEWSFDAIAAVESIGPKTLTVVFCRLMALYDFVHAGHLDVHLVVNFVAKVQNSFSPSNRFHCPERAVDMLQALHYFHCKGMGEDWTGKHSGHRAVEMGKMSLYFGALVAHCGHPGFTNEFLVKTRHPRALRYNDQSVIQNHTMAYISQHLRDPDSDFAVNWEASQVERFRTQLIRMVLKLDIQRHFQELGDLNTKLSSDTHFPQDTSADRAALGTFALRAADLCWAARPSATFQRWCERKTEELFAQGDLEKQVGVTVSAFCDRDVVNTEKAEYATLLILVGPFLSAFALVFENASWSGANDIQREMIDEGEEANRSALQTKLNIQMPRR